MRAEGEGMLAESAPSCIVQLLCDWRVRLLLLLLLLACAQLALEFIVPRGQVVDELASTASTGGARVMSAAADAAAYDIWQHARARIL